MNRKGFALAASGLVALCGAGLWLFRGTAAPPRTREAARGALIDAGTQPDASPGYYKCPSTTMYPRFSAAIPGDASPKIASQYDADCYAWWELITLNWPTAQGAGFGDPGDLSPVQWQTWITDSQLFPPGGGAAPSNAAPALASDSCAAEAGLELTRARKLPLLRATSKFHTAGGEVFGPDQFDEAAPSNAPNWLASQNGHNVWYEVHVSPDEQQFVVQNQFQNANAQWSYVTGDGGVSLTDAGTVVGSGGHAFNLPTGQANGAVGAIETKAAWMEADDPGNARWQSYKLTSAIVIDPSTGKCRAATLALVGLHILHKTASQASWVWATFEHVDNAPDANANTDAGVPPPDGGYNFYNPSCVAQTVSVSPACVPDGGTGTSPIPVSVGCTPNVSPPYYLGPGCAPVPIQVNRTTSIDGTAANQTVAAWQAIQQAYPASVWLHYQLVNVIWSSNAGEASGPVPVPLQLNAMQPSGVVANTTLETYAQNTTCTQCHTYATIARSTADCDPVWNSDVSFLMSQASIPGGGGACATARSQAVLHSRKRR